jgi:hypothetical protein
LSLCPAIGDLLPLLSNMSKNLALLDNNTWCGRVWVFRL